MTEERFIKGFVPQVFGGWIVSVLQPLYEHQEPCMYGQIPTPTLFAYIGMQAIEVIKSAEFAIDDPTGDSSGGTTCLVRGDAWLE